MGGEVIKLHYTSKSYTKRGSYKSPRFFCFLPEDIAVFFGIPTGRRGMTLNLIHILLSFPWRRLPLYCKSKTSIVILKQTCRLGRGQRNGWFFPGKVTHGFMLDLMNWPTKIPPKKEILEKLNEVKLVAVGRKGQSSKNKGKTNPTLLKDNFDVQKASKYKRSDGPAEWSCAVKMPMTVFSPKMSGPEKNPCFEHRVMTYWFGNLRVDFSENSCCAILGWFVGAILIIEGVLVQGHNFRLFWG